MFRLASLISRALIVTPDQTIFTGMLVRPEPKIVRHMAKLVEFLAGCGSALRCFIIGSVPRLSYPDLGGGARSSL